MRLLVSTSSSSTLHDTIGNLALERIAEAVAATPADWVALNQVPVNGRAAVCTVRQPHAEGPRATALTTLTVHKVFRRAEIERQQLRFNEGPPSGTRCELRLLVHPERGAVPHARRLRLLLPHAARRQPRGTHPPSRRATTPNALIERNERILRSMLTALRSSNLPESERQEIISQVVLPRVLMRQGYLKAIVKAGPDARTRALRRLSKVLADPLVADLDPAGLKGATGDHLAAIAKSDWAGPAHLVSPASPHSQSRIGWLPAR